MVLLLVIAALCFAAALVLLAETAMPEARRRHDAVESVRRFSGLASFGRTRGRRAPAVAGAERIGSRFASTKFRDRLPQRLASAGLAGKVTVEAFIAFRAGVAAVGVVGGLCLGALIGASGGAMLFLAAFIGGVAFLATGYSLEHRAKKRRRAIHAALPDALDLLAVTVEAGLGLYGAIQHLVEMTEGPLADELALVLTEVRVGDSSERALKRMAARLQSKEIESLVRSLIQGEQLGLSLARTLRNLAEDTREKRRATAEELASKAPIKMLFPTAFFIFPAMFVAILGPAIIQLKQYL